MKYKVVNVESVNGIIKSCVVENQITGERISIEDTTIDKEQKSIITKIDKFDLIKDDEFNI